jgi:hypothetical protein
VHGWKRSECYCLVFGISVWRLYALSNTNDIQLLHWPRLAIISNRRFRCGSDLVFLLLSKYQMLLASSKGSIPIMMHNLKVQDVC